MSNLYYNTVQQADSVPRCFSTNFGDKKEEKRYRCAVHLRKRELSVEEKVAKIFFSRGKSEI